MAAPNVATSIQYAAARSDLGDEQPADGRPEHLADLHDDLHQRVRRRDLRGADERRGPTPRGSGASMPREAGGDRRGARRSATGAARRALALSGQADAVSAMSDLRDEQQPPPVHGVGQGAAEQRAEQQRDRHRPTRPCPRRTTNRSAGTPGSARRRPSPGCRRTTASGRRTAAGTDGSPGAAGRRRAGAARRRAWSGGQRCYFGRFASIASMTSGASGSVIGRKRATTLPPGRHAGTSRSSTGCRRRRPRRRAPA